MNIWLHKIPFKLFNNEEWDVNRNIALIKKYLSIDFNRMPESLKEMKRLKATEFRAILLDTGAIIFDKILDEKKNIYIYIFFS